MSEPNIKHTEDYYDIVQHGFPPEGEPEDFELLAPSLGMLGHWLRWWIAS
jgi:hypothetical protein